MTMDKLQEACVALTEAWHKAMELFEEMTKVLNETYGRIMQEAETCKKIAQPEHKSVRTLPGSKISTYNYKPVTRKNLPYQRRNF